MALVCPRCDVVPDAAAAVGSACRACGARLMSVDDADPLVGTTLDGRFQLRERIGSGAMGVVYRATQLSIGRDVAVKVISGMDATSVKRFFREAQIASSLAHPNTVQIVDFGQSADGRVFLAMELVRGHSLQRELDKGPMPTSRICRIATQLCDALDAAHKLTIVHRDLKPDNVMIADGDHVKILDFGIARVLGDASTQLTGAGLSAGTPSYMAPEVLGGGAEPAPSQDVYALGVIIAELALGRSLWARGTVEMLYVEKTSNKPLDDVPPRFRPLVRKLLDLDPATRPTAAQARDLVRQLERAATDPVGIAATSQLAPLAPTTGDAFANLDASKLDLVGLDGGTLDPATGRDQPSIDRGAPGLGLDGGSTVQAGGVVRRPVPESVEPLPLANAADVPLELESQWLTERAARETKKSTPPARARSSDRAGGVALLLLLLGGLGAGAYYMLRDQREEPPRKPLTDRGVKIRIVGREGTPVTIDGVAAGETPLSLERKKGKRGIVVAAPGFSRTVVPDRDQTVDISQP